jgi:hypothetical protein
MDTRVKPAYDSQWASLATSGSQARMIKGGSDENWFYRKYTDARGRGYYFGPQIASSLFPLVQEAHIVGVICLVGGLVVYALADRKKT